MKYRVLQALLQALLLAALSVARPTVESRRSAGVLSVTRPQHQAFRHLLQGTCFTCASNCAKCSSVKTTGVAPGTKEVTINAASCKGTAETVSWMCCRGASDGENVLTCELKSGSCTGVGGALLGSGKYETDKEKCNDVQTLTFVVPDYAAELTIQLHDGRANGTVDCTESENRCCGGSNGCGTVSGVCEWSIDLVACEATVGAGACSAENPCPPPTGACVESVQCIEGQCVTNYQPSTFVCGAAAGDCEIAANCTGSSEECPMNTLKPVDSQCRDAAGDCDLPATCTGLSEKCPANPMKPMGTLCRDAAGDCDLPATCTGSSEECPVNPMKPVGTLCRWAKNDKCDLPEFCTGSTASCPLNARRDKAKVFKCGRDCFYCGMPPAPAGADMSTILSTILFGEMTQLKNTWALGSCNTGSCDNHILIQETQGFKPAQIGLYCDNTLPLVCPNGKALSNIIHGVCNGETGKWDCLKQEPPFPDPVWAPWAGP